MTYSICIPVDYRYAHKALALCHSIERHFANVGYKIWLLSFDEKATEIFRKATVTNSTVITPEDLGDKELLATRAGRSSAEFSWTCKPPLVMYAMERAADGDIVSYLDSDQFFFGAPEPIEEALKNADIAIIPHDFPTWNKDRAKVVGIYNAGAIFFVVSSTTRTCLERWRAQCIDWCYYRLGDSRLGDQTYLNEWPSLYGKRVVVFRDHGVNIGTWNLENYLVSDRNGRIYLDNEPLVLFHFHRFRTYLSRRNRLMPQPQFTGDKRIFIPYLRAIRETRSEILDMGIPGYEFPEDKSLNLARLMKQRLHKLFKR